MRYEALVKEDVRSVIRGKGCASRVPVTLKFWTHPTEFGDRQASVGHENRVAIPDWSQLDGIMEKFANPYYPGMVPGNGEPDTRYRLTGFFFCFYGRLWSLRGMTNALMDFYLYPRQVHRLYRKLTDFSNGQLLPPGRTPHLHRGKRHQ